MRSPTVERIEHQGLLLAVVIPHEFTAPGAHFVTPDEFGQQVGLLCHPAGTHLRPHVHPHVKRQVVDALEFLVVRQGRVLVDLYGPGGDAPVRTAELETGDAILLVDGGHGLRILEDCHILEAKQGPYTGVADKTFLPPPSP